MSFSWVNIKVFLFCFCIKTDGHSLLSQPPVALTRTVEPSKSLQLSPSATR